MCRRNQSFLLSLVLFSSVFALQAATVLAQETPYNKRPVQTANLAKLNAATLKSRALDVRRARFQRIKPADHQKATAGLMKHEPGTANFQELAGKTSLQARTQAFVQKAEQAGTPAALHTRRLRGMLKVGKVSKVAHFKKTFVEVTPDNFDLFSRSMGANTVWFAVNDNPNHLHTLLGDQGDAGEMFHNVYGVKTDKASITGNYTQYAMGVHLTDQEMDRFVRYFNAGNKAGYDPNSYSPSGTEGKTTVYGFYTKKGEKVSGTDKIKCTNWATTAPIGDLPRWANTIDRRLVAMANEGKLDNVAEIKAAGGFHAALAAASDQAARASLVQRVLANKMGKWNRSAVQRMHKAFIKQTADFPNRPADLVLRTSLAETLGLSRSQDPAKWSYDLLMSKRAPVVAVFNGQRDAQLPQKTLNWEIMGQIDPSGRVVPGSYYGSDGNQGVIPPERTHQPAGQPAPNPQ